MNSSKIMNSLINVIEAIKSLPKEEFKDQFINTGIKYLNYFNADSEFNAGSEELMATRMLYTQFLYAAEFQLSKQEIEEALDKMYKIHKKIEDNCKQEGKDDE